MFRSIRWRIAAAFAVLLVVCIGGLSAYLSHFFRDNYMDNLRTQLTDQAKLVGDASEPYFVGGETDDLDALAKRLGDQIDARVTIIDSDGTVLGDSGRGSGGDGEPRRQAGGHRGPRGRDGQRCPAQRDSAP